MACADVDMEIHGAAEEPGGADRGQPAEIWSYRASEVVPKPRGPLHDLLQKQPAEFGVRTSDTLSACSYCPSGTLITEFTEMETPAQVQ